MMPVIVSELNPIPPADDGRERYPGSHKLKPHHANMVQAFITVTAIVRPSILPPNISANAAGLAWLDTFPRASSQIAGSVTYRRIQSVSSAGTIPTKNTPRHPHSGNTNIVTTAARPYPIAQELCIIPSAFPRCSAGQVSETSAAPLAHSPPKPRPRSTRNTASCATDCARPQAAVKIE